MKGFEEAYNGASVINASVGMTALLGTLGTASSLRPQNRRNPRPGNPASNGKGWVDPRRATITIKATEVEKIPHNNPQKNPSEKIVFKPDRLSYSKLPKNFDKLKLTLTQVSGHLKENTHAHHIFEQAIAKLPHVRPFPPSWKEGYVNIVRPTTIIGKKYKEISEK